MAVDPFYAVNLPVTVSLHGISIEQLFTTAVGPARRRESATSTTATKFGVWPTKRDMQR